MQHTDHFNGHYPGEPGVEASSFTGGKPFLSLNKQHQIVKD